MKNCTGTIHFVGNWHPFLFETTSLAVRRAHDVSDNAYCENCEKRASVALVHCDGGSLIGAYCSGCAKREVENQLRGQD